ncbi:MAG: hypothetical protein E5Y31_19430 [Mesorhizobium sp.]|nr:MAG: hypothetical protein E5Y31_19430 [Mesorhizobium sp.]
MTRALDLNENTEQNPKRPPQQQTGDDLKKKTVEGKAFQINENSVDNPEPALGQHGGTDRRSIWVCLSVFTQIQGRRYALFPRKPSHTFPD